MWWLVVVVGWVGWAGGRQMKETGSRKQQGWIGERGYDTIILKIFCVKKINVFSRISLYLDFGGESERWSKVFSVEWQQSNFVRRGVGVEWGWFTTSGPLPVRFRSTRLLVHIVKFKNWNVQIESNHNIFDWSLRTCIFTSKLKNNYCQTRTLPNRFQDSGY